MTIEIGWDRDKGKDRTVGATSYLGRGQQAICHIWVAYIAKIEIPED